MDHKAPVVRAYQSQSQVLRIGNCNFDDLSKMQERMVREMLVMYHHKRLIAHWPTISMPTKVHHQCMTTLHVVRQSRRITKIMSMYRQGSWTKVKPLFMNSLQRLPHQNEDMPRINFDWILRTTRYRTSSEQIYIQRTLVPLILSLK